MGGFDEKITILEDYSYGKAAKKTSKYRFLRELPFYTSARRFEKDGRFKVYFKYVAAQLYMLFFGPVKSDIFKYKFGHYNNDENVEQK